MGDVGIFHHFSSKTRLSAIAKLNKLFTTKYVGDLLSGK